jgi:hypothetical protein
VNGLTSLCVFLSGKRYFWQRFIFCMSEPVGRRELNGLNANPAFYPQCEWLSYVKTGVGCAKIYAQ